MYFYKYNYTLKNKVFTYTNFIYLMHRINCVNLCLNHTCIKLIDTYRRCTNR